MTERPPTLSDAFALLEAHKRTHCLWVAADYANRVQGFDIDRLKMGILYIVNSLEKRQNEVKS